LFPEQGHRARHVRSLRNQDERLFPYDRREQLRLIFRVARVLLQNHILATNTKLLSKLSHGLSSRGVANAPRKDEFATAQYIVSPDAFDKARDRPVIEFDLNGAAGIGRKATRKHDNELHPPQLICDRRSGPYEKGRISSLQWC
jgi:hypothetical protein